MPEVVTIGCPNGYHSGNSDFVALWVNMTPEARENYARGLQSVGLTSAPIDYNSSAVPDFYYAPGSPCYEANKSAQGQYTLYPQTPVVGQQISASESLLSLLGIHNLTPEQRKTASLVALTALAIVLSGVAIRYSRS